MYQVIFFFFFFQAEDGIRDIGVTGVQTCALPISPRLRFRREYRWQRACSTASHAARARVHDRRGRRRIRHRHHRARVADTARGGDAAGDERRARAIHRDAARGRQDGGTAIRAVARTVAAGRAGPRRRRVQRPHRGLHATMVGAAAAVEPCRRAGGSGSGPRRARRGRTARQRARREGGVMRHAGGFSIVELLVATAATLVVIGAALALIGQSHSVFAAQPEAADEEQRLRVGVDMLFTDLVAAGAGPDGGRLAGPLVRSFAPVLPFKRGTRADDPAGSYFPDRVTIVSVAPGAARTHLADPSSLPSDWIAVEPQASCPPTSPLCQFVAGSSLAIADGLGEADVVALTAVTASPPMLQHANQPLAFSAYQPTAADLVAVSNVVYVWNAATNQLEVTSSVGGITAPAVDNVVALSFAYYGDPAPPQLTGVAPDDPIGPWTTYGPKPPPLEVQANAA